MTWMYSITTEEARQTEPSIKHPFVQESGGGGACPVQHWGTFTNGWRFYFRFRSNCARLNVAPPGTPMKQVPLVNPKWDAAAAALAYGNGLDYAHNPWWGPVGRVEEVYDGEPLMGFFESEDDLNRTFAECFEQLKNDIGLGEA